jgi:two-component system, cell cycle sensor histidine kinase and response regulator CckA
VGDISAKTFVILWEAATAYGVDTGGLVAELPFRVEPLHRPFARMRWDDYAAAVELLERSGCGPSDFEAIGRHIVWVPSYRFMRLVASALVEPLHLYWTAYRWLRPLLFPHLEAEQYQTADGRLILEFSIPERYAPCAGFMYMVKGSASALPTILDLPPAEVSGDITARHGLLTIHPPPVPSRLWRLRRLGQAILSPMALINELGRQQDEIQRSWASLDRSQRDMQELIERIPDAVIVHRDGLVLYANPALTRLIDLPAGRIVGTALLDHVHPDDRGLARRHLVELKPDEPDAASRTVRVVRGDGDTAMLELSAAQHISFEGRPAVLAVGRDVTERFRLNEQLARTDRMSSLGRLAAGVAHELNNPLAYIELNLHLLSRHLDESTGPTRRRSEQSLEAARHGIERARTIVRDLGTFSRPELDTIELLDVHPLIDTAESMLAKHVAHRAHIERDFEGSLQVMANRVRLEQVFLNLLLNAAQAFREDDREHNRIVIRTRDAGDNRLSVEIEDNGPGIDPSHQGRVFDPFFTTKPVGEGTGLGLAICHGIVTRLGGSIVLRSHPGRGTTFSVTLPATRRHDRPAPPAPRPAPAPAVAAVRRGRVLIIDDEPALARALKGLIEDLHDTELTTSGLEALSILASREFDVVFCDLMMVDLSGMDLFEELERTRPEVAERVVFMTGGAFTRQAREFLERVPNRCLDKPFRLNTVLSVIDECLAEAPGIG